MSAVLPRNQSAKTKYTKGMSHSSGQECQKKKKQKNSFTGAGVSRGRRSSASKVEEPLQSHPFAGFLDRALAPLPSDWRYNISKAIGSIGEVVGKLFPNQNETKMRLGRRGF